MGCNTSKESVPQNEAEQNKENNESKDANKDTLADINDSKSASAKTITLRTNGTAKSIDDSPESTNITENPLDGTGKGKKEGLDKSVTNSEQTGDEELAATKIQAAFRGHQTRKSMKQPGKTNAIEPEPTAEELAQEFREDDQELNHAATKIQATFRGHISRKQLDKKNEDGDTTSKAKQDENQEEELDIDLTDPDLNRAAVKIQASFRGHLTRKLENDAPEN